MDKKIALVTGANKGIGREIALGLAQQGFEVLVGSRDLANGEKVATELRGKSLSAQAIALDVTRDDSVKAAAAFIEKEFGHLDVLVNNAGIAQDRQPPSQTDLSLVERTYQTNVFGPIRTIHELLPLLKKAPSARIVNVSSGLGSLTYHSDPTWDYDGVNLLGYNTSKTALNAVTVQFAKELRGTSVKVNSICPGYCATDLNDHKGHRTAEQGAVAAIRLATIGEDGPSGGYFNEDGELPW